MPENLTKEEKKALRQAEWQAKAKAEKRNEMVKKYSIWGIAALVVIFAISGIWWLVSQPPPTTITPTVTANIAPVSARDISEGPKDAPVTLIEYADFECPACAAYHPIMHQLMDLYKSKVLYVYRMFPLTNIHPNSHISSQAAYAAYKQGAFFQYDDLLYNNQDAWATLVDPKPLFLDYAKQLKLDVNKFRTDMLSNEAVKYVNDSEALALKENLDHTPTFFINGKEINNPNTIDDFKSVIDNELNQK